MNLKLSHALLSQRLSDSEELYTTNTSSFAARELDLLQISTPDAVILPFRGEILALCEAFGRSGQSGGSAPFVSGALSLAIKHLTMQMPVSPITGFDEEWNDAGSFFDDSTYQNKRCSSVFKEGVDGVPYYLEAIVWKGSEKHDTFTGSVYMDDSFSELIGSSQNIRLPFTPKTFYVDIDYHPIDKDIAESLGVHYIENGDGSCVVTVVRDVSQLEEVWEYYDKRIKSN